MYDMLLYYFISSDSDPDSDSKLQTLNSKLHANSKLQTLNSKQTQTQTQTQNSKQQIQI